MLALSPDKVFIYRGNRRKCMKLIYDINDKPSFSQNLVFAFQ